MSSIPDDRNFVGVEVDNPNEADTQRKAVSSGEPSLDGSVEDERGALSDSDLAGAVRIQTLAIQAKGPSSDALEAECRAEHSTTMESGAVNRPFVSSVVRKWMDILGNGKVLCQVIQIGKGPKPRNGQLVTVRVVDVARGEEHGETLTFPLGYSMVIEGLEVTIATMHVGDRMAVKCDSSFAYGDIGEESRGIAPNQNMEFTVELLRAAYVELFTMTKDELIAYFTPLKERGNYYFCRKEYEKAAFVYKRSVIGGMFPQVDEEVRYLVSTIYTNLGICCGKLGDWKGTKDASEEALRLNPLNTKALYRLADAYAKLDHIDDAIVVLEKAHEAQPQDTLVLSELERQRAGRRKAEALQRAMYRRMFSDSVFPMTRRFADAAVGTETPTGGWRAVLTGRIFSLRFVVFAAVVIAVAVFAHFLLNSSA